MNRLTFFLMLALCCNSLYGQVVAKSPIVEKGHYIISSSFSFDGNYIATGSVDKRILIRDSQTGTITQELTSTQGKPLVVCFSISGDLLFSGGTDHMISVWHINSGTITRTLTGHQGAITAIAMSSNGKVIATASKDNTVKIWNVETGETIHSFTGHADEVVAVAFHPNAKMLIAGGNDGKVTLWEIESGNLIKSFIAESGSIKALVYSPNGNYFATAGSDSKINIWNAYNQALENTLFGHSETVETVNYSPDGKFIFSAGQDKYIIMTEISSGEIVFYPEQQPYPITSVMVNPSGREFISNSMESDTIKVWDISFFNIEPRRMPAPDVMLEPAPKPEVKWITENNRESISLGFEVKFKILSELPIEKVNIYVNNERQATESNLDLTENQWGEFENIVYLNDGENQVKIDLFYSEGIVSSDILNVTYRLDIVEELVRASRTRKVSVWLRETDEYEYVVSGAEGYLFHSEKIKVQEVEDSNIGVELVPLKEDVAIVLNNITFATNSADLTPESFIELDRVVELLKTNPRIVIEISAHTDDVGSETYNMLLSNRRAQSVVNYLLDNNVEEGRLAPKGYGPKKPMAPNTSDENRAFNRRVEFKIIEISEKQKENKSNEENY